MFQSSLTSWSSKIIVVGTVERRHLMTGSFQASQYRRVYPSKSVTCSPGGSFISRVAVSVRVGSDLNGGVVRYRDAARYVGEVQLPVRSNSPDNTRWKVVFV